MNIDKILKKEGIELVSTIDAKKVSSMATKISKKICSAFPEHNLNQKDIFEGLNKINMYFANFSDNTIGAKYYYKNSSIYFNRKFSLKKLSELSIHECLHFIQEKRNKNGSLNRYGIYNLNKLKPTGLSLNEASVQTMSSIVNKTQPDFVKYYGLTFYTPSPDYYPIECALLNQLIFFVGSFPVFHSTIYSDDVFKTTFTTKTSASTYKYIETNFDLISESENDLSKLLYSLSKTDNIEIKKELSSKIDRVKDHICSLVLKTQEKIIKECFNSEIEKIKDLKTINDIKKKLVNLKKYVIQADNYNFYNLFCHEILGILDEKATFIKQFGIQSYYNNKEQYLPILMTDKYGLGYFKLLRIKFKSLAYSLRKLKRTKAMNNNQSRNVI